MSADAARSALQMRRMQIDAPYVHKNGRNSDPETKIAHPLYVCMRLDGKGAYPVGAQGWDQSKLGKTADPALFFLQFMFLVVENNLIGSVRPKVCYESSPKEYAFLVTLGAQISINSASSDQRRHFSQSTVCDRYVDFKFLHDIAERAKQLEHLKKMKELKKPKKRAKKQSAAAAAAAEPAPVPREPFHVSPEWTRTEDLVCSPYSDHGFQPATTDEMQAAAASVIDQIIYQRRLDQYALNQANGNAAEEDEAEEAVQDMPEMVPYEGEAGKFTKIQVTVTPIPFSGLETCYPEDIAALLVGFLIRDPAINPGSFFDKIVANRLNRGQASARGPKATVEMFPSYVTMFGSLHPVGNQTTQQTYFNAALGYDPSLMRDELDRRKLYDQMNLSSPTNKFHVNRVLSIQNAQRIMEAAGCDPEYIARTDTWYNFDEHSAIFPPALTTFKYASDGVFWFHPDYIGLREQNFPHISSDGDYLAQLVSGADQSALVDADNQGRVAGNNGLSVSAVSSTMQEIRNIINTNLRVRRSVLQETTAVHYRTSNEFIHRYAESLVINNAVMKHCPENLRETYEAVEKLKYLYGDDGWRDMMDADLMQAVSDAETYFVIRNKQQLACMRVFDALWQTEGNIDDAPIPDPLKTIQKWYRDRHQTQFPNMTREYMMFDPEMGMFSNAILRMNTHYASIASIIHPIVCILAIGLFSCYHQARELKFNMLGFGWHAVGKSRTAIVTFREFTTIDGSTIAYTTETAAASNTQRHVYDTVILSDEVASWKVNPADALKNQPLVNKAKVIMTDNQVGHNVFKNVTLEDGTVIRWTDLVTTDHFVTLVELTNSEVSGKDALASRYFRFMMPLPSIPLHENQGKVDPYLKDSVATSFRISQYLMCCAMKCATVGGILPEPDKELWSAMSGRVIDFLHEANAIDRTEGVRGLDIMWPLVRQFIYMWAEVCAFDMPGSPNYYKKFQTSMIREMQPYLYCTMEIFWWGWTALGSSWVDDNNSRFIEAVESVAGYKELRLALCRGEHVCSTNYDMYEKDVENKIRWKTIEVNGATKEMRQAGNGRLIDINYLALTGDRITVARRICRATKNLSETDVLGILNTLSSYMINVPGGAYVPQPEGMFKEFHKCTGKSGDRWMKNVDPDGSRMPPEYRRVETDTMQQRTAADMPRHAADLSLPVVDFSDENKKIIYIMPGVAEMFRCSIIEKALLYATMSGSFPKGKILLGVPADDNTCRLRNAVFTQECIDSQVKSLNEFVGWRTNADGEDEWAGDSRIPEAFQPMNRRDGFAFNRRVAISKANASIFDTCPTAPVPLGDVGWREKSSASLKSMSNRQILVRDFDEESAIRQHLACGRGFDEPVCTPRYIQERYKRACDQLNRPWTSDMDYPFDWQVDEWENEQVWEASRPKRGIAQWASDGHVQIQPKQARKAETRSALGNQDAAKRRKETNHTIPVIVPSRLGDNARVRERVVPRSAPPPGILARGGE
jgi:hypothetical protein